MKQIKEIISQLKEEWATPKIVAHQGHETFPLFCFFEDGLHIPIEFPLDIPKDLNLFWSLSGHALLFKDAEYGQWGLEILTPEMAIDTTNKMRQLRPEEFLESDLVFGRFIGDSELLLVNCEPESSKFGHIFVSGPIDKRRDWAQPATSFFDFLNRYVEYQGDKYWEI